MNSSQLKSKISFIVSIIIFIFLVGTGGIFLGKYLYTPKIPTLQISPTLVTPISSPSVTPLSSSPQTSDCTKDVECASGYFCDYGYNCAEAPKRTICTKIYSGSKQCIKKCSTNNDCSTSKVCNTYYVASGSDIVVGKKGCQ